MLPASAAEWALAWSGTYLVHSTVAIGGTWILLRALRAGPRLRDVAWKLTLVAPLLSATLQVARPELTVGPQLELANLVQGATPQERARTSSALEGPTRRERRGASLSLGSASQRTPGDTEGPRGRVVDPGLAAPVAPSPSQSPDRRLPEPRELALLGGLFFTVWSLLRLAAPGIRLARRLRPRRPLADGALHDALRELEPRAGVRGVRLTVSEGAPAPLALGVLRPEICVPPRAVAELESDLARALVAHELAHLARRDPAWARCAYALQSMLFFQPLLRVVRRELDSAAELCADDLAVEWTRDGVGLARCLTEVAAWLRSDAGLGSTPAALAMVRRAGASSLRRRVERALDGRAHDRRVRLRVIGPAALAIAVGALSFAGPGVARSVGDAADPHLADTDGAGKSASRGDRRDIPSSPYSSVLNAEAACLVGLADDLDELTRHSDPDVRRRAAALLERAQALEAELETFVRAAAGARDTDR